MVACIHLPEFPAWATYRSARPRVPVVVVHRGRVAAASPRAIRAGVITGMAVDRATALVPSALVVVRDVALESAAWEEALDEILALTPFVESTEPGWAFLRDATPEALVHLARLLGARVGLAPSRGFARVAAVRAAPRYLLRVHRRDVTAFLGRTAVDVLPTLGFPPEMAERLPLLGYPTLQGVRGLTKRHLGAQFGPDGEILYALLHPSDTEPRVSTFVPPPTLRSRVDLDDEVREPVDLLPAADVLAHEVADILGPYRCRRLSVRLWGRGDERPRTSSRILPESTADGDHIARQARALLLDLLANDVWVTALAVELAGLAVGASEQSHLFRSRPSSHVAVRAVHRRFPGAIRRAVVVTDAHFPEDQVRWEPFPEDEPAPGRRRAS